MDRRRRRLRKTKGEFRALDWGVCRDLLWTEGRRLRKTKGEFRALDWVVCRDLLWTEGGD